MPDNTRLNPGTGGDLARTIDRSGNGPVTQVVQLDFGGGGATESLVSSGNPLPVSLAGVATETTLASLAGALETHDTAATGTPPGLLVMAVRRDIDTPAVVDGRYTYLVVNEQGRLKTAGAPAQFAPVTGAITASAQSVSADVTQASNVMCYVTGTFAGHNSTFEGSIDGGTSWFAVQALRSNANTIDLTTGVLGAAPAYAWELSVNALTNFRIRCTAHTSGTANWRITLGSYATEPIPAAQVSGTQPVSGTVTANIGTGSLAAGTNLIGDVGIQVRANATGAASIHHLVSAASTSVAQIKATAGRVYGYCLSNTTASWRYVKLHNVASATAGAAVAMTIGIPPNGKAECMIPMGIGFATAISRSIVTGAADADATATAAADVVGDIFFA